MWVRLLVVAAATVGASACIIGPKQDDPSTLSSDKTVADTSVGGADTGTAVPNEDTGTGLFTDAPVADTSSSDTNTMPPPTDAACEAETGDADAGDARCGPSDADGGSDAVSDG